MNSAVADEVLLVALRVLGDNVKAYRRTSYVEESGPIPFPVDVTTNRVFNRDRCNTHSGLVPNQGLPSLRRIETAAAYNRMIEERGLFGLAAALPIRP